MTGQVVVERDGATVMLTLSNPRRRNALTVEMYGSLEQEFRRIVDDPDIRAVVLRGAEGTFAGGTDIHHLAGIRTGDEGAEYEAHMWRVQKALLDLRVPVIAVVEGACVGGGLVLAALSDLVFCSTDSRFGSPIARTIGNTLSATSIRRLQECFGRRTTSEMLLTGRLLSAQDAERAGFVTAVLEPDALDKQVQDTIIAISACAPLSLKSFKELERRIDSAVADISTADVYREVYGSQDFHEGVDAFLHKRTPRFEGK